MIFSGEMFFRHLQEADTSWAHESRGKEGPALLLPRGGSVRMKVERGEPWHEARLPPAAPTGTSWGVLWTSVPVDLRESRRLMAEEKLLE